MSIVPRKTGLYDTVEVKVNKLVSEIKEKMERNGLGRLDLYTWDYCPGFDKMPGDEFDKKYAGQLQDGQNIYMIDYRDVDLGFSWINVFLRAIKIQCGRCFFEVETMTGNNKMDPCDSLGYSKNETVTDLLHRNEEYVLDALKSVMGYINTLIRLQKDINRRK